MSDFNVDKDVQRNLVSVLGAAGLRIWPQEVAALSRWVRRAKGNGYWDKLIEVIPFCGVSKVSALYKLKQHALNTNVLTATSTGFADGQYAPRFGFTSEGVNALNMGFIPNTMLSANDSLLVAFGLVWGGVTNPANQLIMGALDTGKGTVHMATDGAGTGFFQGEPLGVDGAGSPPITGNVLQGFYAVNRTTLTLATYYRNAVSVGSSFVDVTGVARATRPLYLYGRNNNGTANITPPAHRLTFVMIGTGFAAGDMTNLYNDYADLMGNLRRPVA